LSLSKALRRYISLPIASDQSAQLVPGLGGDMDGHERPDIVKYRNNVFLPLMALFERCMVQWKPEGLGLMHIEPDLRPGEKRVIAVFQDKSCFHANDNKQNAWCTPAADLCVALFPLTLEKEQRQKPQADEERERETHPYFGFH